MATCQQVYSELCATLYAKVTFLCERISDFSEFARTLGSTHSHLIEKLEITLHNYYILAKLPVLTGLKTLVVSPPEWALDSVARAWNNIRPRPDWRWIRKSETIKALKHFADAQTSLERITFVERGWPGCTADAATEVKEALSEIDEHIRCLRSSEWSVEASRRAVAEATKGKTSTYLSTFVRALYILDPKTTKSEQGIFHTQLPVTMHPTHPVNV
ncbi:MAG: hypothetical protein FRX48_04892 [Lasallia pustulata]|uniref:Uncharacterized protein n=1 Tax=Lasallia pustulata TaxID=136370 RepID=A0A5M8PSN1_9LECA|nr:MAG: hypothetical protein FRX48_04892 [Lasallia pustulata]